MLIIIKLYTHKIISNMNKTIVLKWPGIIMVLLTRHVDINKKSSLYLLLSKLANDVTI